MRLGVSVAALAAVTLGCAGVLDREEASEAAPEPAPAASPAAPPPPEAPAPAAPAVRLPEGPPAALTWLEPSGAGCVWSRLEIPAGTLTAVFALDAPCETLTAPLWSPRRDRVVLWQTSGARAWELRFKDEARFDLPKPPLGAAWDTFGYDADGRLVGLAVTTADDPAARALTEGGQTWTAGPELSVPALAHAFTLGADGQWTALASGLVEGDLTKVSAPISAGLPAWTTLSAARYQDRVVVELNLDLSAGNQVLRAASAEETAALGAATGLDGRWAAAKVGRFRVAFHVMDSGDGLLPEPPFLLWDPAGWRQLDVNMDPPAGQSASWPALSWSGPWFIAAMAPYRVQLLDLRTGRTLWTGPGSYAVLQ